MPDPEQIVTTIFSVVISLVVLFMMKGALSGGNVSKIANMVSSLAVPFMIFLFILYIALSLSE